MKKSIVGLALLLCASFAWALPTVKQVEAETQKGNYAQAETMMAEVVAAKPGSAKAHYFYAELLAHNANFSKAADETAKAKSIDPKLSFTDPAKFRAFEQTLDREQHPAPVARPRSARPTASYDPAPAQVDAAPASGGIPGWVWLVGLAVLAVVLWRGFSRSRAQPAAYAQPGGYAPAGSPAGYGPPAGMGGGPGYGPGAAPYGQPARAGSGMLGTGLAVGAGVAGGMLLDEMLHKRDGAGGAFGGGNNIGGFDPESYRPSSADQAASELESRPIDFGNGGDWDSGSSGDSGGGDSGGGGWD